MLVCQIHFVGYTTGGKVIILYWEAAWSKWFTVTDDNIPLNVPSFLLRRCAHVRCRAHGNVLGTAKILWPSIAHFSALLSLPSFFVPSDRGN